MKKRLRAQLLPLLPAEEQAKLDEEVDTFQIRQTPTQYLLCHIDRPARSIALVDEAGQVQRTLLLGTPVRAIHRERSKYAPHQGPREKARRIRQQETQRC